MVLYIFSNIVEFSSDIISYKEKVALFTDYFAKVFIIILLKLKD